MAAHMQKLIRVSRAFYENSRIFSKECVLSRNFMFRQFSVSKDSSENPSEVSSKPTDQPEVVPNPTNTSAVSAISETEFEDDRKSRKIDALIKPAELVDSNKSFAKLFRESNFTNLGNPRGKLVYGTIYRIVGDDMYIDFGWKFPCVVKKPSEDAHLYVNKATVKLRILDLEMSTIFLGAEKETSLNEANCVLVSLVKSPLGVPKSNQPSVKNVPLQ